MKIGVFDKSVAVQGMVEVSLVYFSTLTFLIKFGEIKCVNWPSTVDVQPAGVDLYCFFTALQK